MPYHATITEALRRLEQKREYHVIPDHAAITDALRQLDELRFTVGQATTFLNEIIRPEDFTEPAPATQAFELAMWELSTIPRKAQAISEILKG